MLKNIRNEEGFTLVELLVVVVILVALAAIAVPIFLNQANKAKDAAAQSNLGAIASVIQNGFSTGATVTNDVVANTVSYDGATGKQTIQLGAATVGSLTNPVGGASPVDGSFCIQQAGGTGTFKVTATATSAVSGTC